MIVLDNGSFDNEYDADWIDFASTILESLSLLQDWKLHLQDYFLDANIRESNKVKSPAFSFGLKTKPDPNPVSPSPNTYNTSGITTKGRLITIRIILYIQTSYLTGKDCAVSSSLHIKVKDPKKFVTPSPGAYNPQSASKETTTTAPVYSFGVKPPTKPSPHCPGLKLHYVVHKFFYLVCNHHKECVFDLDKT